MRKRPKDSRRLELADRWKGDAACLPAFFGRSLSVAQFRLQGEENLLVRRSSWCDRGESSSLGGPCATPARRCRHLFLPRLSRCAADGNGRSRWQYGLKSLAEGGADKGSFGGVLVSPHKGWNVAAIPGGRLCGDGGSNGGFVRAGGLSRQQGRGDEQGQSKQKSTQSGPPGDAEICDQLTMKACPPPWPNPHFALCTRSVRTIALTAAPSL